MPFFLILCICKLQWRKKIQAGNSVLNIIAGDGESRNILDAFFLGKAVAEAVNERVESAVGEFFSTIGRLQAERQKQVQEFQVEHINLQLGHFFVVISDKKYIFSIFNLLYASFGFAISWKITYRLFCHMESEKLEVVSNIFCV